EGSEGRPSDAALLVERALAIHEKTLGPQHPMVANTLVALADQRSALGQTDEARRLYERAITIQEGALGDQHPDLAFSLLHLGWLLASVGEEVPALRAALRAERVAADHLAWTARSLAESDALLYASTRVSALDLALSIAHVGVDIPSQAAMWDALVRSRALV